MLHTNPNLVKSVGQSKKRNDDVNKIKSDAPFIVYEKTQKGLVNNKANNFLKKSFLSLFICNTT